MTSFYDSDRSLWDDWSPPITDRSTPRRTPPVGADVDAGHGWIVRVRSCPDEQAIAPLGAVALSWQVWAEHEGGGTVPGDMPSGLRNAFRSVDDAFAERDRLVLVLR